MIRSPRKKPFSSTKLAMVTFAAISFLSWWIHGNDASMPSANARSGIAVATFAGGCLWCLQPAYDRLEGVLSITPGYTGGTKSDPTDEEVLDGDTGHAEAIEVVFDPGKITYEKLLDIYWHNIDPLTANAQFCDHGTQYRTAIFYHDDMQRKLAKSAKAKLEASGVLSGPIVTQIAKAGAFYPAKDYRPEFFDRNSEQYAFYRSGCGRDVRLRQVWGAAAAID